MQINLFLILHKNRIATENKYVLQLYIMKQFSAK
jgi:hypothetical protein